MKIFLQVSFLCLLALSAQAINKADPNGKEFGVQQGFDKAPVSIDEALKNFEKYKEATMVLQGTVKSVCKEMGCWFIIEQGSSQVRVLLKDHGFAVPQTLVNRKVLAVGKLVQKEVPAKVARHYMKDEGLPESQIEKVTDAQKVYQFIADGVRLNEK